MQGQAVDLHAETFQKIRHLAEAGMHLVHGLALGAERMKGVRNRYLPRELSSLRVWPGPYAPLTGP